MLDWFGHEIADTLDELVRPAFTALIMWDYAQGLVSRSFNQDSFVKASGDLLTAARRAKVPVFFSQQGDMPWTSVGPGLIRLRMRQMNIRSSEGFKSPNAKGSTAGEFVEILKPEPDDVVFEKFLPNAFLGTTLMWRLRALKVQTLVLAGLSLETGVEGTAREAVNHGFYAVIAKDATSSTSADSYALAMKLSERLHDVFETKDIIAAWSGAAK